jgi:hypothetical protein
MHIADAIDGSVTCADCAQKSGRVQGDFCYFDAGPAQWRLISNLASGTSP